MPPAKHHDGLHRLIDDLAYAAGRIARITQEPPRDEDDAHNRDAALRPYLLAWASHSTVVCELAEQHEPRTTVELRGSEQFEWTRRAKTAWIKTDLKVIDSWYDDRSRLIAQAYLVEDDDHEVIVTLAGELGTHQMQVIHHHETLLEAEAAAPNRMPAGVLRPATPSLTTQPLAEGFPVEQLIRRVTEGQRTADAAGALLDAAEGSGDHPGTLARLEELLLAGAEFAHALETKQGHRSAARFETIAQQLGNLTQELRGAARELNTSGGVLPPHRVPHSWFNRTTARPAANTPSMLPAAASSPTPTRHR